MSYRLAVGGMDLATYDMAIGDVTPIGDRRAIVVQTRAKARPLVAMVTKIDDTFTSWIDVETGRPLQWLVEERTPEGVVRERAEVDFTKRTADGVPVEAQLLGEAPVHLTQKLSLPEVWDYNALVIALRAWEAKPGTTVETEVMRSRYLWHVTVTVHGEDKVVTDMGDFPALRFDGHSYKLERDGTRSKDPARNFSVWISNDDGRVPLQNTAQSDYGNLEMTLVDYQPGNGNRLRP